MPKAKFMSRLDDKLLDKLLLEGGKRGKERGKKIKPTIVDKDIS